jgi:hypothetical protein
MRLSSRTRRRPRDPSVTGDSSRGRGRAPPSYEWE